MKEMINFNVLMKAPPRCPLCGTPMSVEMDTIRNIKVFACHKERIAIAVTDPLVGKWEEKREEKVPCPMCDTNMRLFFTSTGFLMAKCPRKKCGAIVKGSNPDRLAMPSAPALKLDGVKVDPKNTDEVEK